MKATISGGGSPGNIIIRNPGQQAALEQSGRTGTPAQINTDPTKQNVVTKDKHIDLEPYVSVQSLSAAVSAGRTVLQAIGDAFDKMVADRQMSSGDGQTARTVLLNLKDKQLRAAMISCAQQGAGTACSGVDSAYGTVSSDLARTLIGIVTVTRSENKTTVRETGQAVEGEGEIPESWEEFEKEIEAENGPVLRTPITSPSQVTLPQSLSWLNESDGIAISGSGNLFRSAGTTENGSEPVYEELGPSGETTGKYVTLDSGGNPMAVGGNSGINLFSNANPGSSTGQLELTPDANEFVDILSPDTRQHILYGDGPTSGGHYPPGNIGKTLFPSTLTPDEVIHDIGDIATSPSTQWYAQTGTGGQYTNAGTPAKWVAWETRNGVQIRVVYQPATGKVITAFPDAGGPPKGLKQIK